MPDHLVLIVRPDRQNLLEDFAAVPGLVGWSRRSTAGSGTTAGTTADRALRSSAGTGTGGPGTG